MTKSGREDDFSGAAPTPSEAAPKAAAPPENSPALDAARKSVEDAAAISGGLWLSYLFALFYIGIAAGGVTHRDLLLESPVKLPFLNVELPLVAFFFLAPILFVIVHAYTLVHFVMLAAKVGAYDQALRTELGDADERRDAERRRLPSNIFVQFLAGPHEIREGGLGWLLQAIAWISLVIGPVLLLLLIQAQFLPYHLAWITWVQRFAVLADVVLLWALWPAVLAGRSRLEWPRIWRLPVLMLALVSLVPIGVAITARFPGEWLDERIGNRQWIPADRITARLGATDEHGRPIKTSFHDLLFSGGVDVVTQRLKSPFSNTLVLPEFDLLAAEKIDVENKLEWTRRTVSLRGRHLERAFFGGADLRKADLTGAFLMDANFNFARLDHVAFYEAHLSNARFGGAWLQDASFVDAQLRGAWLHWAKLQGASLDGAQLQGASLWLADLHGASLERAQLQGARLENAQLQGASLEDAQLQGASLEGARLQGASLDGAQLQGASLVGARLQGASLVGARLQGASFAKAYVWRAEAWGALQPGVTDVRVEGIQPAAKYRCVKDAIKEDCDWTAQTFAALNELIEKQVPKGDLRDAALRQIRERLEPETLKDEAQIAKVWRDCEAKPPSQAAYEASVSKAWRDTACDPDGAPNVARVLMGRLRFSSPFSENSPEPAKLAAAFLDPNCAGARGLSDDEIAQLKKIAGTSPPAPQTSTPKQ